MGLNYFQANLLGEGLRSDFSNAKVEVRTSDEDTGPIKVRRRLFLREALIALTQGKGTRMGWNRGVWVKRLEFSESVGTQITAHVFDSHPSSPWDYGGRS